MNPAYTGTISVEVKSSSTSSCSSSCHWLSCCRCCDTSEWMWSLQKLQQVMKHCIDMGQQAADVRSTMNKKTLDTLVKEMEHIQVCLPFCLSQNKLCNILTPWAGLVIWSWGVKVGARARAQGAIIFFWARAKCRLIQLLWALKRCSGVQGQSGLGGGSGGLRKARARARGAAAPGSPRACAARAWHVCCGLSVFRGFVQICYTSCCTRNTQHIEMRWDWPYWWFIVQRLRSSE